MRVTCTLIIVLAAAGAQGQTSFYQCTDDRGQPVFSQRPCGDGAEKKDVRNDSAGLQFSDKKTSGAFDSIREANEVEDLESRIDSLEVEIHQLESARDSEIATLRRKKRYANNNLAGATWEQSISSEMEAVTESYSSRIAARRGDIARYEKQLESLRK